MKGSFVFSKIIAAVITALLLLAVPMLTRARPGKSPEYPHAPQNANQGLFFVDYRNLRGGPDGVALIDLDPESPHFGKVRQNRALGVGVTPHHLYFNRDQSKLYTTALGGANLYELMLAPDTDGAPRINQVKAIDTYGNLVGEDMYFTEDGNRFYMTFMGGDGSEKGGSVGVFDAHTSELVEVIAAPVPDDPASGTPFILYPHGISANEELGLLMITSTIHADLASAFGNTVTTIDMHTHALVQTQLVSDSWSEMSAPVEVMLLRDDFPPYALVSTMLGGDIWVAAHAAAQGRFGDFTKVVEGEDSGLAWALELYIHESHAGKKELYVSFADPGVVNVYSLDSLPALPFVRTLPASPGAHHMAFFETMSGREVVVVQNNLLNLAGLDAGTLDVLDIHTGEVLATLDMAAEYEWMPESVEWAYGHGHDYHH